MHSLSDFTQPGGLWLTQDTLKSMQEAYAAAFDGLAGLVGDKTIVSGVRVVNNAVTDGWAVYNGQLLPFVGSQYADNVDTETIITQEQYEDGTQKNFNVKKRLVLVGIATATSFPFTDLVRPGEFKNVWLKNDTKDVLCDNAYITANFDINTGIALPNSERFGWRIAFEMGGRVKIGWSKFDANPGDGIWDAKYNTMLEVGGEKLHALIANENAPHVHEYYRGRTDNVGPAVEPNNLDSGGNRGLHRGDVLQTSLSGAGEPHNNVQPYLVALTIVKI